MEKLSHWQRLYDAHFSMAVNLSPAQLFAEDFVAHIESVLSNSEISANTLEFEITEGMLVAEHNETDSIFKQLDLLGVKLAMDDFGTGYSSLSYLRKYSFDTLKIDREFVAELEHNSADQKLVAATIAMAHGLGLTVVAEGVENEKQYQFLKQYQCDLIQGWLFSKALPAQEIELMLKQQQSERQSAFTLDYEATIG